MAHLPSAPERVKVGSFLGSHPARAHHKDAALLAYVDALDAGLRVFRSTDRLVDGRTLIDIRIYLLALAEVKLQLQLLGFFVSRLLSVARPFEKAHYRRGAYNDYKTSTQISDSHSLCSSLLSK